MKIDSPEQDPTAKDVRKPDPRGDQVRKRSREILQAGGFHFAEGLPTAGHRAGVASKPRPIREVALRFMALKALFIWVVSPESSTSSVQLNAYIDRNNLRNHLTKGEREILALSRADAHEQHSDTIGWRLENMWALAWVLGFDPPPDPVSGQLPDEISRALVLDFLPGFDASVDDLLKHVRPRTEDEVVELEDFGSHPRALAADSRRTSVVYNCKQSLRPRPATPRQSNATVGGGQPIEPGKNV